jgi:hypothetical protein
MFKQMKEKIDEADQEYAKLKEETKDKTVLSNNDL